MSSRATSARRVLGRYELGPAIGRGATAVVHRAHDIVTDEVVAVKVVPVELDLAPRVRAEVRAAGRLDHPRIVALRDWGEDSECLYLVWDLVEGRSLAEWLREPEPLGDGALVRIGEDVFAALAHAHARGVVHRDVKPGNILVDNDGRAHLSDFGVARLSGESGLTMTGGVVGTVAYMSPEQARGEPVGPDSDVYSAALVVYEGLAGRNPVSAPSPAETARRAAAGGVAPLAGLRADLPPELCRAIDAGLRRDPAARPEAAELADALSGARGGVRAARRRGVRALPVIACAAFGAALAGVALTMGHERLADATGADWRSPAIAAAVTAVAAVGFAWRPRAAALCAVVAGAVLVGLSAPLAGLVFGAIALVTLASGWRFGRITLLAAAGPALAAVGLWPLLAAIAGLRPRWAERLWVAAAGVLATVAWQVGAGSDGFLAGGGYVGSAVGDLDGESSPEAVVDRLWQPLADRPEAAVQAAAMIAAALCVPLVARARDGGPRVAAACLWIAALGGVLIAASTDGAAAAGAVIPSAVVVVVWAFRPWRGLRRRPPLRASATLRGPTI